MAKSLQLLNLADVRHSRVLSLLWGASLLASCDSSQPTRQTRATGTTPAAATNLGQGPNTPSAPPHSSPKPQLAAGTQGSDAPGATAPGADENEIPRGGARVYPLTRNVWIRSAPESGVQWIGSLWLGGSVKVRGPERVPGAGCSNVWVPIEPRGWVCIDDRRATLDPEHPLLVRLFRDRARTETAWPHRYAVVPRDVTRYRLPPEVTPGTAGAGSAAAALPFELARDGTPDLPLGLYEGRTKIVARSALAYVRDFPLGEHTYLLMPDFSFVRRDQVEPVPPGQFAGVRLDEGQQLPLAFVQGDQARLRALVPGGAMMPKGQPLARLAVVPLSGRTLDVDGATYHELRDGRGWLHEDDAVVPRPRVQSPFGETLPAGRATWIEGSILEGWLVAFEGKTPVYATLISAGRGGTPVSGKDPVSTASTPTGRFFITGKFATATMESSTTPIVHGDVPWTQNFSGPHAIHSAYWHDGWGELKSAGCVNVSPRDGKWLFGFTEPAVPEGWHAVKHVPRDGPATLLILHE